MAHIRKMAVSIGPWCLPRRAAILPATLQILVANSRRASQRECYLSRSARLPVTPRYRERRNAAVPSFRGGTRKGNRQVRKAAGLSQRALSEKIRRRFNYISIVENSWQSLTVSGPSGIGLALGIRRSELHARAERAAGSPAVQRKIISALLGSEARVMFRNLNYPAHSVTCGACSSGRSPDLDTHTTGLRRRRSIAAP